MLYERVDSAESKSADLSLKLKQLEKKVRRRDDALAEQDKAMAMLRQQSADMVIDISRKVLKENLDEDRSRKLTDSLIEQI